MKEPLGYKDTATTIQPRIAFSDLPKSAHTRIFFLSDLVSPYFVNLLQEAKNAKTLGYRQCRSPCLFDTTCFCPPLHVDLLCVSKQVNEEALAAFFNFNKFAVCLNSSQSLEWLLRCPPTILSSVRSLRIRFGRGMNAAISDEGPTGNQLSSMWAAACTYLKANLTPGLVRFSFGCELSSAVTARRTATSLELLPMMATCDIHFGLDEDQAFQALARRTVREVMKHRDKQFPIERLPSALRARVLYLTELVARPRSLEFAKEGKMHIRNGRQLPQPLGRCGSC